MTKFIIFIGIGCVIFVSGFLINHRAKLKWEKREDRKWRKHHKRNIYERGA